MGQRHSFRAFLAQKGVQKLTAKDQVNDGPDQVNKDHLGEFEKLGGVGCDQKRGDQKEAGEGPSQNPGPNAGGGCCGGGDGERIITGAYDWCLWWWVVPHYDS